jgi:hypothetical protein
LSSKRILVALSILLGLLTSASAFSIQDDRSPAHRALDAMGYIKQEEDSEKEIWTSTGGSSTEDPAVTLVRDDKQGWRTSSIVFPLYYCGVDTSLSPSEAVARGKRIFSGIPIREGSVPSEFAHLRFTVPNGLTCSIGRKN